MSDKPESPLDRNAILLLVLTALFSSHALDLGQLVIVAWDTLVQGKPTQKKYQVEAGLILAGTGLVVLAVIGARNALQEGSVKDTNTVLASLVTGLIGLSFSILDKTADPNGIPTQDTARGLIFVIVGGCVLLPPYLAMPSTRSGFRHASATLAGVGTAGLAALLLGAIVQFTFVVISWFCEGVCSARLETHYLSVGSPHFYISAPTAGAFAAALAVLSIDPTNNKDRWQHFTRNRRNLWLFGVVLVGVALSTLYALGSYYPQHGEIVTSNGMREGWMRQAAGAEIDRRGTVMMLLGLQMPGLVSAVLACWISPVPPRGWASVLREIALLVLAAGFGGACAWAVTEQVDGTGQLKGKEYYFIAAHAVTAALVMLSAWLPKYAHLIGSGQRKQPVTSDESNS